MSRIMAREIVDDYGLHEIELADGDVVIDVGANVGVVASYVARRFPKARIIALEPMAESYAYLQYNLKANGITNVEAVRAAVTGDGRRCVIEGNLDENSGGANIYGAPGRTRQQVESLTVQQILQERGIERVALLKLDCEGAEHEIARHLAAAGLLERIDRLRCEVHVNNVFTVEMADETIRLLEQVADVKISRMVMADSVTPPLTDGIDAVPTLPGEADVTVIIPTLNGAKTIARAIDAALAQSVKVEVIVIDDGSTDETADVLTGYGERIRVITHEANVGQVPAMNAGLAAATGRYILFQGDDDWLEYPNGLKPLVDVLDIHQEQVGFAYGHLQYHGMRTDISAAIPYRRDDYRLHFPAQTGVIWRRSIALQHGLQYRTLHDGKTAHAEDFDMILQIIKAGYVGQAVNGLVIHYTLAPGRATSWLHAHEEEVLPLWKKRHPEFIGRL